MTDRGHELTDEMLKELESDIHDEYEQAVKDMQAKLSEYLATFEKQDAVQKELLKAGKITEEEYKSWAFRHKMMGKRWEEMRDVLAEDMHNTNEIAHAIAKGRAPDVYALNMNYATYDIEHGGRIDTGFTLYDHDTAAYLLSGQRDLMPEPSTAKAKKIAANKDMQWNMKKIQSAVLQGVLQGESPYKVAKRLTGVGQMNENASVRYARTMTTSAQNAGRYNAFRRAKDLGVDLTIEWSATLDGRTRHEHRMMHGQRRNVDEPFEVSGVKILYPAQAKLNGSNIPQELIWNCRCTLLSWVKGFEGETVKQSAAMGDMSFEEWQHAKEKGKTRPVATSIKEANDNGRAILEEAYENHRKQNGLKSASIKELKDANIDLVTADYGKMSIESANAFNDTIRELVKEYDTPLSHIRTMTKEEYLGKRDSFAFVRHDYTNDTAMLVVNQGKCKDLNELVNRIIQLSNNGYSVRIKPEFAHKYVATHEFAHSILNTHSTLSSRTNWVGADYNKIRAARKEITSIYDRYIEHVKKLSEKRDALELQIIFETDIKKANLLKTQFNEANKALEAVRLSKYSLTNADEFMAEAFTNQKIGINSNSYGEEVVEVLKKYFGRS